MLAPAPAREKKDPRPPSWEVTRISLLVVALQAGDRRIRRLEELNHQAYVALDDLRRGARRRAA